MRLFLIDPHEKRLYNNGLFDTGLDPNFIVWKRIRSYLAKKNIEIATIDLHPIETAERIYFLDHDFFSLKPGRPSYYLQKCIEASIPKSQLHLVITECPIIKPESWLPENHTYYGTIYTWNDSLIDNKKYFHYRWVQNLNGIQKNVPAFSEKKLLTLINAHKTNYNPKELYSLRIQAIRFYEKHYPEDFDLYGIGWNKPLNIKFVYSVLKGNFMKVPKFIMDFALSYKGYSSYKGAVEDKIEVMRKYKFSLCFENMENIDGYITEKIFDSLKAGTIPVYLGAQNIQKYIPKGAFVDFRNFSGFEELTNYLIDMKEEEYHSFIDARNSFLKMGIEQWDYKHFAEDIFLHE